MTSVVRFVKEQSIESSSLQFPIYLCFRMRNEKGIIIIEAFEKEPFVLRQNVNRFHTHYSYRLGLTAP